MQTREHSEQSAMAMGLVSTFIFDPSYENYMQFSLHLKILKENGAVILKYLSSPIFSESAAPLIQHMKAFMLAASIKDANREQNASEVIELLCKLLQSDPNNSLLWNTLSLTLTKLDSLTQNMQEKLFALTHQHKRTPMQFKAFCSGQSIVHNEKHAIAWHNLGIAFSNGASLADLPQACREQHFKGKDNWNAWQLAAFCSGQAIVYDEKHAIAWHNLGVAFSNGATLADLPQACREQHFQGKDNLSGRQLHAFCSGQAILCDEKLAPTWNNLGHAFPKGASLADLPQACLEQHFQGKENLSGTQLQAFCLGQAIVCDEKFAHAWNSLGTAFSNGASLADLPQACLEQHFQGKENWTTPQLQAFCAEKFAALKKPASNPHSSTTSSAETNSSAAVNHKRKTDEVLENPIKKQKTRHSNPSSITRPTASHPSNSSSTSNTASSSSMSRAVAPANPLSTPNPFYRTYPNPALHPAQQQYPNALSAHSHTFNDGNGYPIPHARPPQPLPQITIPTHPGFVQRIHAPTQNPQPEVQITGSGAIPALNNLAHQATLFKIKEEPAETQKANPDSQNNGNHSKKM